MRLSHVSWNLLGLLLPLGVAVAAVPQLVARLGQERFGLLALAWGLIGYAGALDLGIGRALTQAVGRMRGERRLGEVPDTLATASRITAVAGVVGGGLIVVAALFGGSRLVGARSTPMAEVELAMILLAVALPAQAMSATYRGLNEAFMNFRGISLLRAGLGAVNFGGPWALSFLTDNLAAMVATLVGSRLVALFLFRSMARQCLRDQAATDAPGRYSSPVARSLYAFAGWVSVSSVVSPIMMQADRFVIASTLSAAAVTVYVLPYEVVVQNLVLVGAVSSVMFPGLSALVHQAPDTWRPYFRKWLLRVAALMALVCVTLVVLLPIVLPLWIRKNLGAESVMIGQVLTLGVFANALGSMFYALLHARGRADLTAKAHLVELPIYAAALFLLLGKFGLVGAAWAWVGRMAFDAAALGWWSMQTSRGARSAAEVRA